MFEGDFINYCALIYQDYEYSTSNHVQADGACVHTFFGFSLGQRCHGLAVGISSIQCLFVNNVRLEIYSVWHMDGAGV